MRLRVSLLLPLPIQSIVPTVRVASTCVLCVLLCVHLVLCVLLSSACFRFLCITLCCPSRRFGCAHVSWMDPCQSNSWFTVAGGSWKCTPSQGDPETSICCDELLLGDTGVDSASVYDSARDPPSSEPCVHYSNAHAQLSPNYSCIVLLRDACNGEQQVRLCFHRECATIQARGAQVRASTYVPRHKVHSFNCVLFAAT